MKAATPEAASSSYPTLFGRPLRETVGTLRPREMVAKYGHENVPEHVLLAVILRSGVRGRNVADLASFLMAEYGSLTGIARADVNELEKIPGLGKVKAQVLKAALELGLRLSGEVAGQEPLIQTPSDAYRLLKDRTRGLETEVFWVLCLDTRNRLKRLVPVTSGLADASLVHAREVFKHAIRTSSTSVIVAHNHPSGDPSPSPEDIVVTRNLVEAGRIVDIRVLDHVIAGQPTMRHPDGFCSLREEGLVEFGE